MFENWKNKLYYGDNVKTGIIFLFLFIAIGCGILLGINCSKQEELNTEIHKRQGKRQIVEDGEVICNNVIWHFLSYRKLVGERAELRGEFGMIEVKGTYKFTFENDTTKELRVDYGLRFCDKNDLVICKYDPGYGYELTLSSGESREISDTFEVTVGDLAVANSIVSMKIYVSFKEVENNIGSNEDDIKTDIDSKEPKTTFSIGSTQEEVIKAQGTPKAVDTGYFEIIWTYGNSTVTFSKDEKVVIGYYESSWGDKLNVK